MADGVHVECGFRQDRGSSAVPAAARERGPAAVGGTSGPPLFARYAFGPNRLGLCGPEDWSALLQLGSRSGTSGASRSSGAVDGPLRELAKGFEGAWPYLALIARSAGLEDPLDARVVELYWLGSRAVAPVPARALAGSLDDRFRRRSSRTEWRWLAGKPAAGAVPVHAFHVLDVLPRTGLMRGGQVEDVLGVMDSCRIRWGRVVETLGDRLLVSAVPLEMVDGRLRLGAARLETVRRSLDGRGFTDGAQPGDVVSLHWDWACDRLDARQLRSLVASTRHQVAITNQTI